MNPYYELTKPRITRLVLWATLVGYYLGSRNGFDLVTLFHVLVGTALVSSGTNGLNQWWERDIDAQMNRTRHRPLPSRRLTPKAALNFTLACSVIGIVYLVATVNVLTAVLAATTLVSYVAVYTPMKQVSPYSTHVGSLPGALPILGGWTAATGAIHTEAWILFGIMAIWQLPHFLALAWLHREDYRRGGLKMFGANDESGSATGWQAFAYMMVLFPISLAPTAVGLTGGLYALGAFLLGVALLWYCLVMAIRPGRRPARQLFLASVTYLPAIFLLMVIDKATLPL
ncbi:MAG: heme o synthase [Gemmatimonadota bacterium]|nr:heme o synthase [Gemmatimonadota bacterium]